MKRMSILGLCLFAAISFSAITVASASASPPDFGRCVKKAGGKFSDAACNKGSAKGKFEWLAGSFVNPSFEAKMKKKTLATLESVGGTKITCTAEENKGSAFTGEKTVGKIVAKFSGCSTSGIPCSSAGEGSGKITTFPLKGLLGPAPGGAVETQLTPEGAGPLAAFVCGPVSVETTGCVAHFNTVLNKMTNKSTEVFAATKGEQNVDKFAGGPEDECALASKTGTGTEEAGQTITAELKSAEKVEINTAV